MKRYPTSMPIYYVVQTLKLHGQLRSRYLQGICAAVRYDLELKVQVVLHFNLKTQRSDRVQLVLLLNKDNQTFFGLQSPVFGPLRSSGAHFRRKFAQVHRICISKMCYLTQY